MTTKNRRLPLTVYVLAVLTLGAILLIESWTSAGTRATAVSAGAFWLLLSLAAETFWVPTPGGRGMVSMSLAANIAVLFVLPRADALSITATSVVLADLMLHRREWLRALFNGAQSVIATAVAFTAMRLFGAPDAPLGSAAFLLHPAAALAALPAFMAANTLLVSGAIALSSGMPFWHAWIENYGFGFQHVSAITLFIVGLGLAIGVEVIGYMSGLASLLVLLVLRDAYRYYLRKRDSAPVL